MKEAESVDVLLVGGGPVGLFLAAKLAQLKVNFMVVDRRTERRTQSRAIGIHPPSLSLMADIGIAAQMVAAGVAIRRGHALSADTLLGTIDFSKLDHAFPFVLSLPQSETERMLEEHVQRVAPGHIRRGCQVVDLKSIGGQAMVTIKSAAGFQTIRATWVAGTDGRNSAVRERAGIKFEGGAYSDTFVMGDFQDRTNLESDAAVYLDQEGFIESFPLPGKLRRWVMQTPTLVAQPREVDVLDAISRRTGHDLQRGLVSSLSSFGVEHYIAETAVRRQVWLCGDSAHVMSPIGGQGMNIGWMDAVELADTFSKLVQHRANVDEAALAYNDRVRSRARAAIKRAEHYMAIGRSSGRGVIGKWAVGLMLKRPLHNLAATHFTMQGM